MINSAKSIKRAIGFLERKIFSRIALNDIHCICEVKNSRLDHDSPI